MEAFDGFIYLLETGRLKTLCLLLRVIEAYIVKMCEIFILPQKLFNALSWDDGGKFFSRNSCVREHSTMKPDALDGLMYTLEDASPLLSHLLCVIDTLVALLCEIFVHLQKLINALSGGDGGDGGVFMWRRIITARESSAMEPGAFSAAVFIKAALSLKLYAYVILFGCGVCAFGLALIWIRLHYRYYWNFRNELERRSLKYLLRRLHEWRPRRHTAYPPSYRVSMRTLLMLAAARESDSVTPR